MNRKEQIRRQLETGLPSAWITDEVVEAVALAIGDSLRLKYPAPECAESRHGVALLRYAAKIEDGSK